MNELTEKFMLNYIKSVCEMISSMDAFEEACRVKKALDYSFKEKKPHKCELGSIKVTSDRTGNLFFSIKSGEEHLVNFCPVCGYRER